jgi:hypothetical protein
VARKDIYRRAGQLVWSAGDDGRLQQFYSCFAHTEAVTEVN